MEAPDVFVDKRRVLRMLHDARLFLTVALVLMSVKVFYFCAWSRSL
jgi:hypothetical protein